MAFLLLDDLIVLVGCETGHSFIETDHKKLCMYV